LFSASELESLVAELQQGVTDSVSTDDGTDEDVGSDENDGGGATSDQKSGKRVTVVGHCPIIFPAKKSSTNSRTRNVRVRAVENFAKRSAAKSATAIGGLLELPLQRGLTGSGTLAPA
jgi:hypothetical protein